MYLVHSYYAENCDEAIATTDYELNMHQLYKKIIFMEFNFIQKRVAVEQDEQIITKNFLESYKL